MRGCARVCLCIHWLHQIELFGDHGVRAPRRVLFNRIYSVVCTATASPFSIYFRARSEWEWRPLPHKLMSAAICTLFILNRDENEINSGMNSISPGGAPCPHMNKHNCIFIRTRQSHDINRKPKYVNYCIGISPKCARF